MHLLTGRLRFRCRCRRDRTNDVLDMVDRVRYTSIFCYALVIEVDLSVFIQSNVLKKSVTFDCIVNIRLGFFVQVDNFCIASAFEVEYAVVIPAVLVITDQKTFRVCGKSCFTCSGSPKKIAVFSPFMSVFAEQCIEAMPFNGRK